MKCTTNYKHLTVNNNCLLAVLHYWLHYRQQVTVKYNCLIAAFHYWQTHRQNRLHTHYKWISILTSALSTTTSLLMLLHCSLLIVCGSTRARMDKTWITVKHELCSMLKCQCCLIKYFPQYDQENHSLCMSYFICLTGSRITASKVPARKEWRSRCC